MGIGATVRKYFEGFGWFEGIVTAKTRKGWMHICYEDGDEEDVSEEEYEEICTTRVRPGSEKVTDNAALVSWLQVAKSWAGFPRVKVWCPKTEMSDEGFYEAKLLPAKSACETAYVTYSRGRWKGWTEEDQPRASESERVRARCTWWLQVENADLWRVLEHPIDRTRRVCGFPKGQPW